MYGHRLIRELLGLLFLFCGLLMLLSLWSYHPDDPSFNHAVTASVVHNAAGVFGAHLAGFLVESVGIGSFLCVIFFLAVGAGLVSRWLVLKWYRWVGYLLFFSCILVSSSAFGIALHGVHGGGLAGNWLLECSMKFFSPSGSFLLWIFVFLIAMELSFSISWLTILSRGITWGMGKIPSLKEAGGLKLPQVPSYLKLLISKIGCAKTKSVRPRAVLDLLAGRKKKTEDGPAGEGSALELNLHEETAQEKEPQKNSLAEKDAKDLLILAEDTQAQQEDSANAEEKSIPLNFTLEEELPPPSVPASGAKEDFILELEEPSSASAAQAEPEKEASAVTASMQVSAEAGQNTAEETAKDVQDSALAAADASACAMAADVPAEASPAEAAPVQEAAAAVHAAEDPAEEEKLNPSALAALSAQSYISGGDFPAVVVSSHAFAHNAESLPAKGAEKDEEYASVDAAVAEAMAAQKELAKADKEAPVLPKRRELSLPPLDLLSPLSKDDPVQRPDNSTLARQGAALITCLKNFNVHATLARITTGPVVTMFEVRPAPGVKATRITNLANDLAMSLKAVSVRMQAPVPGTDTVGVEVPNEKRSTVQFREIVENESFRQAKSLLTVALGKDTGGRPVSADLAKMPHLLVAGATGAGKSVCLNAIILSLLYRARPDEVQMILVDPKRVELSMYADLPHLVHPVVTDMDLTKNALLWALDEMNHRLSLFSKVKVRNITGYNERQARLRAQVEAGGSMPLDAETGQPEDLSNMPFLVIIVDELADLMMVKRKEVEPNIVRLAQLARAAGIHLIIATQRPSVDVVTGLIKANFPCRIAFKVTSGQDSRTILDCTGAEKLLGMGDMLFKPNGGMIQRLHGAFVSDDEVSAVVEYWKRQQGPSYKVNFAEFGSDDEEDPQEDTSRRNDIVDDPVYAEAVQFVLDNGKVSISLLQRRFRIGFNRAARFVEQMEKDGLLSQADGTRPRSVVHR